MLFMPSAGPESLKVFKYSCWLFAVAGVLLAVALLRKRSARLGENPAARTWLYLSLVSIFFQLPLSLWFWTRLPELRAAEFPFRFLPLCGVALPLILFGPATRRTMRKPVYTIVAILTLSPFLQHFRTQLTPSTRLPPIAELVQSWRTGGHEGLAEYWPAGMSTRPTLLVANPSGCTVVPAQQPLTFEILATAPCDIQLPILDYPYWHASDDSGQPLATHTSRSGHIALAALPGVHTVRLSFQTASKVRTLGAAISIVALILFTFTLLRLPRVAESDKLV